jgi:hypothetical protein
LSAPLHLSSFHPGLDPREIPRYSEIMSGIPPVAAVVERAQDHEQRMERQQRAWLEERGLD